MKKSLRSFGIIAMAAVLALAACGGGSGSSGGSSGGGGGVKVVLPNDGDGLSAATAYKISNAGQLKAIAKEVNNGNPDYTSAYYELTNDIDLSPFSKGTGWEPIGNDTSPFSGTFDGCGFVISNLAVNDDTLEYVGLFGLIYDATVANLGLEIASITGKDIVGGVAGAAADSTVSNCHTTGNIKGNDYVGGVVGVAELGIVSNCYATGNVEGNNQVGGVAGALAGTIVTDTYATGNVKGNKYVGGAAGQVVLGGEVKNCHTTGDVEGHGYVGGAAGEFDGSFLTDTYATGNVTGTDNNVGGVVGMVRASSEVKNCYATGNVTGTDYNVGGVVGQVRESSEVKNCHATGDVEGNYQVGGVAGVVSNSSMSKCYATGKVKGSRIDVGGVVGRLLASVFENCYATGNVEGNSWVGGVVGYSNCGISNCYATGDVTGDSNYVGGIAGEVTSFGKVSNCAALNNAIVVHNPGSYTNFTRVKGGYGAMENNVANSAMTVVNAAWTAANVTGADATATGKHGFGIAAGQISNQLTYSDLVDPGGFDGAPGKGLGWNFGPADPIWKWGELVDPLYKLPVFYGQTEAPAFPPHL